MRFTMLRGLLALAMGVLVVAAVLLAAGTLGSMISGKPLETSLTVVTDRPVERPVVVAPNAAPGVLKLTHGSITFRPDWLISALQLAHVALMLAASLACIWLLRKVILSIAARDPFGGSTLWRMRALGMIQIATFLWTILHAVMLQSIIVPRLSTSDGAAFLSSTALRRPGIENVQIDFTISLALLAGGLIALAVAEAFRIGADYREDNEAIV